MPFGLFRSQKYVQLFSWQRKNHRMFLWLHRYRLYQFRLSFSQKGFAPKKLSINGSSINMKPPAKKGKRGESLDWPRDLAEKVPVSPYFCPVLNEKSHK
ncbi:hypothetical protein HMPREF1988_01498 [Porphyromonas gingivalis F0185]|nr:hypothetical protein HMPREF1988_01498 [Porphyromonas gingivalis F0185]